MYRRGGGRVCRIVVTYQNLLSAVDSLARAQPRQQQLLPQALRLLEPLVGHGGLRVVSRQLVAIN